VAVARVLAEAQVGDHEDVGHLVLDLLDGPLDDPVLPKGARGVLVLLVGDAEEHHRRDAQVLRLLHLLEQAIDGHLEVAGHGLDGLLHALARDDEERVDEIVDGELRLADEPAQVLVSPHAPGTVCGKKHGCLQYRSIRSVQSVPSKTSLRGTKRRSNLINASQTKIATPRKARLAMTLLFYFFTQALLLTQTLS